MQGHRLAAGDMLYASLAIQNLMQIAGGNGTKAVCREGGVSRRFCVEHYNEQMPHQASVILTTM